MARRYRVEISTPGEADVEASHRYLSERDPEAADRWLETLERALDSLETMPSRCAKLTPTGGRLYRQLVLGNFRLVFRIAGTRVIVVRVVHSSRLLDLDTLK